MIMIIFIVVGAIFLLALFGAGFVSASPREIKVISGWRKQRVLHGRTGWKVPILERVDTMTAEMISIDAKTTDFVTTKDFIEVKVDAAIKVRIGVERPELFKSAIRNFLYKDPEQISNEVRDTLEGHLRAIIGRMDIKEIVQDKVTFSTQVQENATKDLEEMGLEIVAFNIQNVIDKNDVIKNLGIDNTERIRKDAAIAKAIALQEVAEQEAKSSKIANDARVDAEVEIAQRNNELEIKKAQLKTAAEVKRAQADASYEIEQQTQRKEIERQTAEANIVKAEKEAEIQNRNVKVMEEKLSAEIKKQADAEKYARQQQAEAEKIERMNQAEAEKFEAEKEAEALKARAEAERFAAEQNAIAIEKEGRAEAEAIRLKLEAEADGLNKKAEAMLKLQDAGKLEMVLAKMPEIARAVAEPLSRIDSITMFGEGNSSKLVGDIMTTTEQINKGLGLNIQNLIQDTLTGTVQGRAMARGIKQAEAVEVVEPVESSSEVKEDSNESNEED